MCGDIPHLRMVHRSPLGLALAILGASISMGPAWAQAQPPAEPQHGAAPSPPGPVDPPPAPAPRENSGLINEIGKLLDRRPVQFPGLGAGFEGLKPLPGLELPAAPDGAGVGSGGTFPRLDAKIPSMQKGREKCPATDSGAVDCKAAADALCRAQGFQQGKSVDSDATEKCSAEALLLSGRKSQPGACRTDYFVTRAWCQ